jgi:hypothetical protein
MQSKASFDRTEMTISECSTKGSSPSADKTLTFTFRSRHLVHDNNCLGWGFFFDELDSAFCCDGCNCKGWGAEGP